jgi:hypothetical protein
MAKEVKANDNFSQEELSTIMKVTGTIISFLFVGYSINPNVTAYLSIIAMGVLALVFISWTYLFYESHLINILSNLSFGFYTVFMIYLIVGFWDIIKNDQIIIWVIITAAVVSVISYCWKFKNKKSKRKPTIKKKQRQSR